MPTARMDALSSEQREQNSADGPRRQMYHVVMTSGELTEFDSDRDLCCELSRNGQHISTSVNSE